jgi:hypothetical protein
MLKSHKVHISVTKRVISPSVAKMFIGIFKSNSFYLLSLLTK